MAYVDAKADHRHGKIKVVERVDGLRVFKEFPIEHSFYYDDPKGLHTTIFNTPVSRFETYSKKEFDREVKMHPFSKTWEVDISPVLKCLEDNYLDAEAPDLHVCFFDIEVGFDKKRGHSDVTDPFNPIQAISLYLDWIDQLITLVVPPPELSEDAIKEIINKFENTIVFSDESSMLLTFYDLIEDADILTGWFSEGYDIPYIVNRTSLILSRDDTRKLCLWGEFPRPRTFERYGKTQTAYDLVGRVHLDYMQLYQKYTYHEMHSYSLDAISEYELGDRKIAYTGTLDQLYHRDFETFIDYNRQDVMLIHRMDVKNRFISLANQLAHENTVLLPTTMGAVAVTEQGIINEAHKQGMVVPNKKRGSEKDTRAAGAYVAKPVTGLHKWIGAMDINSLYPSVIRALNMGPETIVGQLRQTMTESHIAEHLKKKNATFAGAWEDVFSTKEYEAVMNQDRTIEITVDWERNMDPTTMSAEDVWHLIFHKDSELMLSANGTIFTFEREGVIPALLKKWYADRKVLQAEAYKAKEAGNMEEFFYWDRRQLVKKINLNSLYGALLNPYCRFFDFRIGQSTTLTGRAITKHMSAFINEVMTDEYDHVGKAIIYGDTDSCYFSSWPLVEEAVASGDMQWTQTLAHELYTSIANQANDSFPAFMEKAFHCPRNRGDVIRGSLELVADSGLFITKKRYALQTVIDDNGRTLNTGDSNGKVKAMGLDLKRSDTPKDMQDFLSEILADLLSGKDKKFIVSKIREFKSIYHEKPAWEKGTPKRVNNLTMYTAKEKREGKANLPGHVRAAMNWNTLRKMHSDNHSMEIMDGAKTIVCKLRSNPMEITSIAYPVDMVMFPAWFTDLPFDDLAMEKTIIDKKIDNLLGDLGWKLEGEIQTHTTFNALFDFGS